MSRQDANLPFRLVARRHGKASMILPSNKGPVDRSDIFSDAVLARRYWSGEESRAHAGFVRKPRLRPVHPKRTSDTAVIVRGPEGAGKGGREICAGAAVAEELPAPSSVPSPSGLGQAFNPCAW